MTKIRFDHLHKQFGTLVAVDQLELTIEPGEIFFLLGPSGCGKSTLLRLIAGLHTPTSGRIFFNDRDVTSLTTDKRNAAMCFQSYALWPHMNVRENIRFGLDVRKIPDSEAKARVDEAIALVQLQKFADRKPNELSGGQQQRVALARALVVRPDCLLLDEPLSNLDAKLRLEMRTEIRRICKSSGLTAIYVTHDQKEALSIADRMAVLNQGRVEQVGRPQELYLRPANRFVANFMGETNFIEGTVIRSAGGQAWIRTAFGELVSSSAPQALVDGSPVTISLRPESIRVGNRPGQPSHQNTLGGELHDTIYLGEVAQHAFTSGTSELRVFEMNPRIVARDNTRAAASVWFEPEDVVVLRS